jgi:hypothetical protein
MTAPDTIRILVDRFGTNLDQLRSAAYNETQIRREYLDPLFLALGWDVDNRQGFALPYREVIHEDSIVVAGGTKAPDYSFRVGGMRKFFVEAKKPSVNLKDDAHPAFQLRRYAWSANLPLSILTDFEEFAVYDCRNRPSKSDKASNSRISFFTFAEYIDKWEEIHAVFSKDAVLHGSFDTYAETKKGKKGTADVDDVFLEEIETWRSLLARNIALRNPKLSQTEINFAVQRTVDRIIFLRICEDRGIETYGRLQELLGSDRTYKRLVEHFRQADDKYNSGLFHFSQEKDRSESLDTFTLNLKIDDKVLKEIIGGLYYPESPYEFSVLPADILGSVYERFLGKVIRLTKGHQAKIEEKPEVRKAGGVYYTPKYIVDYIVKNTVGKLVDGSTPKEASSLRVLDPACGSGSFLIGAYQYLLDWHRDWYTAHEPEKLAAAKNPPVYLAPGGEWKLTTAERKRILLNAIYGVDIDSQAVEVTKLSLLLKVLEGENEETINAQIKMFHERALPDLGSNIKCGNSLIGPDFFDGKLIVDAEERMRINAFDWKAEFKEIMDRGGFDAVIGNPPYGAMLDEGQKGYVQSNYQSYQYKFDTYIYFLEKGVGLMRRNGLLSFITPELWLKLDSGENLRRFLSTSTSIEKLLICGEGVFVEAVVNTIVVLILKNEQTARIEIEQGSSIRCLSSQDWRSTDKLAIDYRLDDASRVLIGKTSSVQILPLSSFGDTIQGITAYDKYQGQSADLIKRRGYHFDSKHDETCGRWLEGRDIGRFILGWSGEWLSYGPWLAAPRDPRFFTGERLLFREIPGPGKRIQATIAWDVFYHGHSITPCVLKAECRLSPKYVLGLVNSRFLSWVGGLLLSNFGKDVFPKLNPQDIKSLPIRTIDFSDSKSKSAHDSMVRMVETLLQLHKDLPKAKTDHERTAFQRQIDATDKQIDALVYELYGLTEEEIRIVEGNAE